MNTLKSAALMVVLLGVLYGVYVALNKPEPPPQPGQPVGDVAPPAIEFGGPATQTTGPRLAGSYDEGPAISSGRSVRGGVYQPAVDPTSLPPPTSPAASIPVDPTAGASSGLQRSTYETPATSPASEALASQSSSPSSSSIAPASAAAAASPSLTAYSLRRDLIEVEQLASAGKYKSALSKLTPYYANADLTSEQRETVMSWLDALAGKVIYSKEHLLTAAHQVRRGETLYDVAHQYNVEFRLLQNINREVSDPLVLIPSTELKVIPGPFRADVNLSAGEMTLLVGDLYAGRFPFVIGDQPPQPGEYKVIDKKSQQKTYIGFDGRMIPANDPNNPYGGWWLSLGGEIAIHGSPVSPASKTLGCISLSPQDAQDVYGILSVGSEVKIRR